MAVSLQVLNLPLSLDSDGLESMFSMIGNVQTTKIEIDEKTGLSRGVGYVEMSTELEAENCILYFNSQVKKAGNIFVRENKPHIPQILTKKPKLQLRKSE
ncbi:MAG: RNA-binding protein [Bdellovibrionales bacterium]